MPGWFPRVKRDQRCDHSNLARGEKDMHESDVVHMTRNESADSQELLNYNTGELYSADYRLALPGMRIRTPINPALSAGLIPWRNQFTVGGCYTYRTRCCN